MKGEKSIMWIKICGITSLEAAKACAEAGVDAVGFVFAESRRKITVEEAGNIIERLPRGLKKVGVFVNESEQKVSWIQNYLGLDLLQFHGAEGPSYCSRFSGKAIKAFSADPERGFSDIKAYRGKIMACLIDSYLPGQLGGTGVTWDWKSFKPFQAGVIPCWLIAAGGLNPGNVYEALQSIRPEGVDVSSGVEKEGEKDINLIKQFVNEVRRWEANGIT